MALTTERRETPRPVADAVHRRGAQFDFEFGFAFGSDTEAAVVTSPRVTVHGRASHAQLYCSGSHRIYHLVILLITDTRLITDTGLRAKQSRRAAMSARPLGSEGKGVVRSTREPGTVAAKHDPPPHTRRKRTPCREGPSIAALLFAFVFLRRLQSVRDRPVRAEPTYALFFLRFLTSVVRIILLRSATSGILQLGHLQSTVSPGLVGGPARPSVLTLKRSPK